ncbi:MAG: hypothetical protein GEU96_00330 [Propionibacteriales bacterium]|nr:hypothetical protein [Propionibacteriales bacterium]
MQVSSRPPALLRTYATLIVLVTLLTTGSALLVTLLRPSPYVSTAHIVVSAEPVDGGAPLTPDMGTEREIALSGEVARSASRMLDVPVEKASDGLEVEVPVDTNVLELRYSADTPEEALRGAQDFTRAYVAYRNRAHSKTAQIITPPSTPRDPVTPNFALILGLSLTVGFGVGIVVAFAWDRLTPRLRDAADAESQTGLPVLATIPALSTESDQHLVVGSDRPPRGTEAYGHLAVRLRHLLDQRNAHVVLVTSPVAQAGKTTVAANLATSLAATGMDTVVVSADTGDAGLHTWLGVSMQPGLREVLQGTSDLGDALRETSFDNLRVLPCGGLPDSPSALYDLRKLADLLEHLAESADAVVIEAPSVLGGAETAMLAEKAELVLLVLDIRSGRRADASAAAAALGHVENKLAGCVLNDPGRKLRPTSRPKDAAAGAAVILRTLRVARR